MNLPVQDLIKFFKTGFTYSYKNSKIPFLHEKTILRSKFQFFFSLECPKVGPLLEFLSQAVPKMQENKVFWINVNFSKMESAVMSIDVSLR
jgi:hypothetical protein